MHPALLSLPGQPGREDLDDRTIRIVTNDFLLVISEFKGVAFPWWQLLLRSMRPHPARSFDGPRAWVDEEFRDAESAAQLPLARVDDRRVAGEGGVQRTLR